MLARMGVFFGLKCDPGMLRGYGLFLLRYRTARNLRAVFTH